MTRRRRTLVAALTAGALAFGMAGCGAKIDAASQKWYQPADGTSAEAGAIGIRNALVVHGGDGEVVLLASFANKGADADQLVGVTINGTPATIDGGVIELPSGGVGVAGPNGTSVRASGLEVVDGTLATLGFIFANGPRANVESIVHAEEGYYADVVDGAATSVATPVATPAATPEVTPVLDAAEATPATE